MNLINNTYRIIALTMAFLMFFSSVGFSIDMHFCQGQLQSFSLFGKAKNCHEMANVTNNCSHHQKDKIKTDDSCTMDKKDCCDSKTLHFQSDQDQQIQVAEFTINQQLQQFIIAYVAVFFYDNAIEKNATDLAFYKPPLIPRDIPVLFETFLI